MNLCDIVITDPSWVNLNPSSTISWERTISSKLLRATNADVISGPNSIPAPRFDGFDPLLSLVDTKQFKPRNCLSLPLHFSYLSPLCSSCQRISLGSLHKMPCTMCSGPVVAFVGSSLNFGNLINEDIKKRIMNGEQEMIPSQVINSNGFLRKTSMYY